MVAIKQFWKKYIEELTTAMSKQSTKKAERRKAKWQCRDEIASQGMGDYSNIYNE